MKTDEYNGWKNYETWNVSLWINDDEGMYNFAKSYRRLGYKAFAEAMIEFGFKETLDGVSFTDSNLDFKALDEMLSDL